MWDLSQERAFIELLLNQRFNFFLVFVGLTLTAAVTSRDTAYFSAILIVGSLVSAVIAAAIFRAHVKLDTILKTLRLEAQAHPFVVVDTQHCRKWSMRRWIGGVLPLVLFLLLLILGVTTAMGIIRVPRAVGIENEPVASLESDLGALWSDVEALKSDFRQHEALAASLNEIRDAIQELPEAFVREEQESKSPQADSE